MILPEDSSFFFYIASYSGTSVQQSTKFGSTQKKFRRVCMEFSEYNWATISETICPQMLIFGK